MARETFKVEGLRELEEALKELPVATGKSVLRRVLIKAGQPIESSAESMAPRGETGKLIGTIETSTKLSRRQRKLHKKESPVEVYVGPGPHPKGVQQEFGNANHGPQAFMRPAWDGNHRQALDIIKTELGTEIKKAADRLAKKAARLAAKA